MFNLLIKRELNDFSVTEARDALMDLGEEFKEPQEARKYIYRQILTFERKGWLVATGHGRDKKYQKTELLKSLTVVPRTLKSDLPRDTKYQAQHESVDLAILRKEKNKYEAELSIVLSEIDEFQSLMKRFPKRQDLFLTMLTETKEHSVRLLGKINVLSKVLLASRTEEPMSC